MSDDPRVERLALMLCSIKNGRGASDASSEWPDWVSWEVKESYRDDAFVALHILDAIHPPPTPAGTLTPKDWEIGQDAARAYEDRIKQLKAHNRELREHAAAIERQQEEDIRQDLDRQEQAAATLGVSLDEFEAGQDARRAIETAYSILGAPDFLTPHEFPGILRGYMLCAKHAG